MLCWFQQIAPSSCQSRVAARANGGNQVGRTRREIDTRINNHENEVDIEWRLLQFVPQRRTTLTTRTAIHIGETQQSANEINAEIVIVTIDTATQTQSNVSPSSVSSSMSNERCASQPAEQLRKA